MTDFLDTYNVSDPPPGVTANWNSPNARGIVLLVICFLLFLFSTLFGGIRIYTKAFITRALGLDDGENLAEPAAKVHKLIIIFVVTCVCTMVGHFPSYRQKRSVLMSACGLMRLLDR